MMLLKILILFTALAITSGRSPPITAAPQECPPNHHCYRENVACIIHPVHDDVYQCQCADGFFGDGKQSCEKITCRNPGRIDNGFFEKDKTSYDLGEGINYSCNTGYELDGEETRTCISNGNLKKYGYFTPDQPSCSDINECLDDPCGRNEDCTNTPGSYRCACKEGYYDLNGECVGICGIPMDLDNGSYEDLERQSDEEYLVGDTVIYECKDGYKLEGEKISQCKDNMEFEKAPHCVPICRKPMAPTNGFIVSPQSEYNVGDEVVYRCNDNHNLVGASRTECTGSLSWSNKPPQCIEIRCDKPMAPKNGRFVDPRAVKDSYSVGSVVEANCNRWYKKSGENLVCEVKDGKGVWSEGITCTGSCSGRCNIYSGGNHCSCERTTCGSYARYRWTYLLSRGPRCCKDYRSVCGKFRY